MVHLEIRSEDQQAVVEILGWDLSTEEWHPSFSCTVRVDGYGFAGTSTPWFTASHLRGFLADLKRLDETRRGQAKLESMSPGECTITFEALDRRGHIGLTCQLAHHQNSGERWFQLQVSVAFEVDPTGLLKVIADLEERVQKAG